jgi:hypothetical protein
MGFFDSKLFNKITIEQRKIIEKYKKKAIKVDLFSKY